MSTKAQLQDIINCRELSIEELNKEVLGRDEIISGLNLRCEELIDRCFKAEEKIDEQDLRIRSCDVEYVRSLEVLQQENKIDVDYYKNQLEYYTNREESQNHKDMIAYIARLEKCIIKNQLKEN